MKKLLAALMAITLPIWYIPFCFIMLFGAMFKEVYKDMLKLLEGKKL